MSEPRSAIEVVVNGRSVRVPQGTMVTGAIALVGEAVCRTSVDGEPRGALCGMGICFECRVTVNGEPHVRACQKLCRDGMSVTTGASR